MSDERCPKCGSYHVDYTVYDGVHILVCVHCDFSWEAGTGAYFAPRDRLPTEAEERAHLEQWGKGAGWMVQWVSVPPAGGVEDEARVMLDLMAVLSDYDSEQVAATRFWVRHGVSVRAYPHVNGRPVGWPTVEEDEA